MIQQQFDLTVEGNGDFKIYDFTLYRALEHIILELELGKEGLIYISHDKYRYTIRRVYDTGTLILIEVVEYDGQEQ